MKRIKVLKTGRIGHPDQRSGFYTLKEGEERSDLPDEVVEVCVNLDPPRVEILDDEPELEESDEGPDQAEGKTEDGGEGERESKTSRGGLFGGGKRSRKGGKGDATSSSPLE